MKVKNAFEEFRKTLNMSNTSIILSTITRNKEIQIDNEYYTLVQYNIKEQKNLSGKFELLVHTETLSTVSLEVEIISSYGCAAHCLKERDFNNIHLRTSMSDYCVAFVNGYEKIFLITCISDDKENVIIFKEVATLPYYISKKIMYGRLDRKRPYNLKIDNNILESFLENCSTLKDLFNNYYIYLYFNSDGEKSPFIFCKKIDIDSKTEFYQDIEDYTIILQDIKLKHI